MITRQIHLKLGMEMPYAENVSTAEMVNNHSSTIELRIYENSIFLAP